MESIESLVSAGMKIMKSFSMSEKNLQIFYCSCFKPIVNKYASKGFIYYNEGLMSELERGFLKQYEDGIISRQTRNKRIRGLNIIREINDTGTFKWKIFTAVVGCDISGGFKQLIDDYLGIRNICEKNIRFEKNILSRFVLFLNTIGIADPEGIDENAVLQFIKFISIDCKNSMDKVMTALSRFLNYLYSQGICRRDFSTIIRYARPRNHYVHKPMGIDELKKVVDQIDISTATGKRDYAIMVLAINTGLRAGDIVSLKLKDIDYKNRQIRIIQGKTSVPLILPLNESVLGSLADYILNGRPQSDDERIFLRSLAPFTGFKDGVSVACVFRRYLKKAGLAHELHDGRTFHGIRRMIGTQMAGESVPVTTIAQVLGHQSIVPTKQYISLDLKGLNKCILPMSSLGGSK